MAHYTVKSIKGEVEIDGTRAEAISAAIEMERELQPAFGVTVYDDAGVAVNEVQDGVAVNMFGAPA